MTRRAALSGRLGGWWRRSTRNLASAIHRSRRMIAAMAGRIPAAGRAVIAWSGDIVRRASAAVARGWATIRPRSRRGALALGGLALGTFVVLVAGMPVVASLAGEYGSRPDADEAIWRGLAPAFGESAQCGECHEPQEARLVSTTHAGIGCQSCHGALGEHALASPGTPEAEVRVDVPTDTLCVVCHVETAGRPLGFRQVAPEQHYVKECLDCHDPHTGISRKPPIVEHTLLHLPPCVTCHGPEGFKARNQRHPVSKVGEEDDERCIACHVDERGTAVGPRWAP